MADTPEIKSPPNPTVNDVADIMQKSMGKHAQTIEQFPTGIINFVYGVTTDEEQQLVVRLTVPESKKYFQGAMHWYELLKTKEVPLPTVHYADVEGFSQSFPTMIMDRIPGKDLGDIYQELSSEQKKEIAQQIVSIQKAVATLPMGNGFGYALSENDPTLKKQWIDVLDASLERSRQRIKQAGVIDEEVVDKVKNIVHRNEAYFSTIEPKCFLDDTTTKNVMVNKGELTGIIDVDSVAYGDPLFTVALTRMSLLAKGYDTDYIDYWLEELQVTLDQQRAVNIYTALFCVEFLSEIGQKFNKEEVESIDQKQINKLNTILVNLLTGFSPSQE